MSKASDTEPPFVIYLQVEDEWSSDPLRLWDMTWCYDRIHESDARYIRDDDEMIEKIEKLCHIVIAQGDTKTIKLAHSVLSAIEHRPGENDQENEKVSPPDSHSGGDS